MAKAQLERKLENMIMRIIENDLTYGRSDNDFCPYTSDQIDEFITQNQDGIQRTIRNIIQAYEEDGELELLENPLYDWITEFLYDEVKTIIE